MVRGAVRDVYFRSGGPAVLGFPIEDEHTPAPVAGGTTWVLSPVQRFTRGYVTDRGQGFQPFFTAGDDLRL
jgi:hypothetical protein